MKVLFKKKKERKTVEDIMAGKNPKNKGTSKKGYTVYMDN